MTIKAIVLHEESQASFICCQEVVRVHYKVVWDVATGYVVNGYMNSCFIWVVEGVSAGFGGGFFVLFCFFFIEFLFQLLFLIQFEKQTQNYKQKLFKFS